MDALDVVLLTAGGAAVFCWISSLLSGDSSWIDRLWSIVPVVYVAIFAGFAGFADARLNLMLVLVALWGGRLTFNFARKGGYTGTEDYRWPILRARMRPWQYQLFNLGFIVLFQSALLVLIALPALTAYEHRGAGLGPLDWLAAVLFLAALAGETIADQQQWRFHQWKRVEAAAGREPQPRFLSTGLWRYSRHPNFFFEQAQWWLLVLFAVSAAGTVLVWNWLGAVLLTALFIGSTVFTESITRSKYPEYAEHQRRTSMLVPLPPRSRAGGAAAAAR